MGQKLYAVAVLIVLIIVDIVKIMRGNFTWITTFWNIISIIGFVLIFSQKPKKKEAEVEVKVK